MFDCTYIILGIYYVLYFVYGYVSIRQFLLPRTLIDYSPCDFFTVPIGEQAFLRLIVVIT